ncbi:MAG: LuxR C-terminal-related transcriptional regulator [Tunicatimonas sp.]
MMHHFYPLKGFLIVMAICAGIVFYYGVFGPTVVENTAIPFPPTHKAAFQNSERQAFVNVLLFVQVGIGLAFILAPFLIVWHKNQVVWRRLQQRKLSFFQRQYEPVKSQNNPPKASAANLDQQFSARLLLAHPGLTPYEIKLCTLLWKNYSSKEIAGALNITMGSVNTARYRLRKKLTLPRETDLIIYLKGLA